MFVNKMTNRSTRRASPLVVGISGKRGTGKTFYGRIFLTNYKQRVRVYAFAEVLKEYVRQWFNLNKEQTDGKLKEKPTRYVKAECKPRGKEDGQPNFWTPREMMIEVGQFFRKFDVMFWVKKVLDRIKPLPPETIAIITDVRFKNEANAIKELGGIMIRLERDPKLSPYEGDINDISETDLDDYDKFDFIVSAEHNRNPQDASRNVEKIMQELPNARQTPTLL